MVKEFALNAVYTSSKIQMFRTSSAPIKIQKYIAEVITQERVYFSSRYKNCKPSYNRR